ncbi:MAG: glycosyltransferase family 9 protein, partial [Leeuwenhoekiella sp.]
KKEVAILNNLASKYKSAINMAGRYSFEDELSVISRLDAMLAMDSGNGHMAAMFGVPVVTLWGVTHPSLGFKPFLQPEENQLTSDRQQFPLIPTSVYGKKVPPGYENAMRTISPKKIVNRIKQILD